MSLDHAILGFLQYKPLSGYDLKTAFDMSVRHFWPADQSQIYRTLARLADGGLTEVEIIEQDERPDRKVYHITDDGRAELHRWLTTELPSKGERIAALVQIFFAGQLTDAEILALFQRHADHCREALAVLRGIPQDECPGEKLAERRDAFFWMLTLDYGIRTTETCLSWLEEVIGRLERGEHMNGGPT